MSGKCEVLLVNCGTSNSKAYLRYGDDFARHLDGEYGIAVLDGRRSPAKLVLARDPFGTKPLWLAKVPGKEAG